MKGPDRFGKKGFVISWKPFSLSGTTSSNFPPSLEVDEVINCLIRRWDVSYDLQLVVKSKRLYLQVMWAYQEQQSFPLDESAYRLHIAEILEVVNRLGLAEEVRDWLAKTPKKPRVGKALSLKLEADQGLDEFVL